MQFKVLSALAFATLAAATVTPVRRNGGGGGSTIPASQCNTGDLQCCNSAQAANSAAASALLGLLGIVVEDVSALVGLTCTPISAIGVGGNSCTAQPVCCTNNTFSQYFILRALKTAVLTSISLDGVVALGCTPVNINL
ncbi:hypothetical protein CVT25_001137 [Psilocybe cyanescens]|uniref:Hydrophobin n=1 Tax=Psilocybe cyanescens TaxID=93625 RepID=A0A409XAZ9_PSICY|nr:hypothetical protein CVT25_001137 [Psilocybe cyanescens]